MIVASPPPLAEKQKPDVTRLARQEIGKSNPPRLTGWFFGRNDCNSLEWNAWVKWANSGEEGEIGTTFLFPQIFARNRREQT